MKRSLVKWGTISVLLLLATGTSLGLSRLSSVFNSTTDRENQIFELERKSNPFFKPFLLDSGFVYSSNYSSSEAEIDSYDSNFQKQNKVKLSTDISDQLLISREVQLKIIDTNVYVMKGRVPESFISVTSTFGLDSISYLYFSSSTTRVKEALFFVLKVGGFFEGLGYRDAFLFLKYENGEIMGQNKYIFSSSDSFGAQQINEIATWGTDFVFRVSGVNEYTDTMAFIKRYNPQKNSMETLFNKYDLSDHTLPSEEANIDRRFAQVSNNFYSIILSVDTSNFILSFVNTETKTETTFKMATGILNSQDFYILNNHEMYDRVGFIELIGREYETNRLILGFFITPEKYPEIQPLYANFPPDFQVSNRGGRYNYFQGSDNSLFLTVRSSTGIIIEKFTPSIIGKSIEFASRFEVQVSLLTVDVILLAGVIAQYIRRRRTQLTTKDNLYPEID